MKLAVPWTCIICLAANVAARGGDSTEPVFEGKPASEWIYLLTVNERAEGAAQVLHRAGKAAIPSLVAALKDYSRTDADIRRHVPLTLAAIGPDAVPELTSLLEDKNARGPALAALWLIEKDRDRLRSLLATGRDEARGSVGAVLPGAVPEFVRLIGDPDPSIRENAIHQLRLGRAAAAIPALADALNDSEARVRRESLDALKELAPNGSAVRPALWGRIKDEDRGIRVAAARMLLLGGELTPDDETTLLTTLLEIIRSDRESRTDAIGALQESRILRARGFESLMKDADVEVRRRVSARYFHEILYNSAGKGESDPAVVATLAKGLKDEDPQIRYWCLWAQMKPGPHALDAMPALIDMLQHDSSPKLRRLPAVVMRRIGPPAREAIPALLRALRNESDVSVQDAAAEALWAIDHRAESVWHLERRLRMESDPYQNSLLNDPKLFESELSLFFRLLNEPDSTTRYNVALRINEKTAHLLDESTILNLLADPDPRVRREVLRVVWVFPKATAGIEESVARCAKNGETSDLRHYAVGVLGHLYRRGTSGEPLVAAAEDADPSIRSAALHAMGNAKHPKHLEMTRRQLKDSHADNRSWAAWTLKEILGKDCVPELTPLLDDQSEKVRDSAAELIWAADANPIAVSGLLKDLASETPSTKSRALYRLEKMASKAGAAVPALIAILVNDPETSNRARAATILRQSGEAAKPAVPALRKACDDPDFEVRVQAAWALWAVDRDPRTVAALAEAGRIDGEKADNVAIVAIALQSIGAEAVDVLPQIRTAKLLQSDAPSKYQLTVTIQKIEAAVAGRAAVK